MNDDIELNWVKLAVKVMVKYQRLIFITYFWLWGSADLGEIWNVLILCVLHHPRYRALTLGPSDRLRSWWFDHRPKMKFIENSSLMLTKIYSPSDSFGQPHSQKRRVIQKSPCQILALLSMKIQMRMWVAQSVTSCPCSHEDAPIWSHEFLTMDHSLFLLNSKNHSNLSSRVCCYSQSLFIWKYAKKKCLLLITQYQYIS